MENKDDDDELFDRLQVSEGEEEEENENGLDLFCFV